MNIARTRIMPQMSGIISVYDARANLKGEA
jgi:hypothetical protein